MKKKSQQGERVKRNLNVKQIRTEGFFHDACKRRQHVLRAATQAIAALSSAALVKHFCVIIPGINMAVGLLWFTPIWSQAAPIDMQNFLFDSRSAPASPFQEKTPERNTQECSQLQGINPNLFIYLDRKTPAFPPFVLPTESSPPRHLHSLWWRGGAMERRLQRIHWPPAFCLPRTHFYFPTDV